jgi:hypothetical protein
MDGRRPPDQAFDRQGRAQAGAAGKGASYQVLFHAL